MSQNETDNRNVEHRIDSLLSDAQAAAEASDENDAEALRDVASGVHFLVETADITRLLEAVGVDFEGDATPASIPEAIARSDSDAVLDLRFLLLLSRLSKRDGEEAEAIVDDLRELAAKRAGSDVSEGEADVESGTEASAESGTEASAESETEPVGDEETEAGEGADAESEADAPAESGEETGLERLESAVESHLGEGVDGFREEIETARAAIDERFGDEDETAEDEATDDEATDEDREDREDRETGRRLTTGGSTGTLSTVPATPRRDMNTPRRLSTVRRK